MIFTEAWLHPSGLTIKGFDSKYVGPLKITAGNIDTVVSGSPPPPSNRGVGPPRKFFEGFAILRGDSERYLSDPNQGEQAGTSDGDKPPN